MRTMKHPPLQPLIPLEKLKSVVVGLLSVPKAELDAEEAARAKRPRSPSASKAKVEQPKSKRRPNKSEKA